MRELHQQVKVKKDIKKIWLYSLKEHGEKRADKYYDELIEGMETIKSNPYMGIYP